MAPGPDGDLYIYDRHHQTILVSFSLNTKIYRFIRSDERKSEKEFSLKSSHASTSGMFFYFVLYFYDSAGAIQFPSLPLDITFTLSFISPAGKLCFPPYSPI